MKLYPYARANEHGHAVALFSSSPSKRTAAYRKPCAVDRAEDLDALLAAAWGGARRGATHRRRSALPALPGCLHRGRWR